MAFQCSFQDRLGTVSVLLVGGMHHKCEDESKGVDGDMTLAPLNFLAGVVSPWHPSSVVRAVCESTIQAVGPSALPTANREILRNSS